MQEILTKLNDNLNRQTSLYEKLSGLAKQKQKALIQSELSEIDRITGLEEKLIVEAGRLEQERQRCSEQIGKTMGKPVAEMALSELADIFPELKEVQLQLEKVLQQLRETHEINAELLKQAIQIVNYTVNLMTRPEETTYGLPGKKTTPVVNHQVHLLDKSV